MSKVPGTYGKRVLWFSHREWEGRVCPVCEGPKTPKAGLCWKCAALASGYTPHNPASEYSIPNRVFWLLRREWGRAHPSIREVPTELDDLLAWASTQSDRELLSMRNFGKKMLRWVRDHQPSFVSSENIGDPIWGQPEVAA